ncbi:U6 snRNA phosphodiesterase isoform X2 [Lucilia sericata]|uniref:U6 snRNA phosphodiesterase isoform X2 n=1 Tax=Lucilia sericata TaxID=13632 RepID=UPI0018A85E2A|nr:U6 snRNA phosphodiesterase isoform X2 [Lucilia sericata]
MFLVNYSSSSESEDENQLESEESNELTKSEANKLPVANRKLLPQATTLLGKRKLKSNDDDVTDDPSKHDGRIRSFKHERGNWATCVYLPVDNNLLEDIQDICLDHLEEKLHFKASSEMHISLTKTVVLQYHLIESFVSTLQNALQTLESFTVSLDNLKVYTNAERTRTFLALKVDNLYFDKMLNILQKVDKVMKDFKLATFYEDPSFHISILWCTGDCEIIKNLNLIPVITKEHICIWA